MKKYNNSFCFLGQSLAGRIQHCQKVGVAVGITEMLKAEIQRRGIPLKTFLRPEPFCEDGRSKIRITVIIPTKEDDYLLENCPIFECNGNYGVIDMLMFDRELNFHTMWIKGEAGSFVNGGWHTADECLTLEQTCTLFEYVDDVRENMIIPPKESEDKYIENGALGVGV